MKREILFITACTFALSAWAADPDPCRLITAAEIGAALGNPATGSKRGGPDIDKESKARSWSCDHKAGKLFVSVNVAEFGSPAAAGAEMAKILKVSKEPPETMPITESPGLGDRSLWGANEEGALWIAQKGKYVLNVTAAGELANPQALRDPLRRLMAAGLGRL